MLNKPFMSLSFSFLFLNGPFYVTAYFCFIRNIFYHSEVLIVEPLKFSSVCTSNLIFLVFVL